MKRFIAAALAVSFAFAPLTTGCGTVLGHSGIQEIKINLVADDSRIPQESLSEVSITVNGNPQGKGPGVYKIDSTRDGNKIDAKSNVNGLKVAGTGSANPELMSLVILADAIMLVFPILIDYFDGGRNRLPEEMTIHLGIVGDTSTSAPDFPSGRTNSQNDFYTPTNNTPANNNAPDTKPCPFCGEMRPVNSANCPHCGQH